MKYNYWVSAEVDYITTINTSYHQHKMAGSILMNHQFNSESINEVTEIFKHDIKESHPDAVDIHICILFFGLLDSIDTSNIDNQVESNDKFLCDTCSKAIHAGVWGVGKHQPCYWCKGQYISSGDAIGYNCRDYDEMNVSIFGDTRPTLC